MAQQEIKLGDTVKERISGFQGVAVGRANYLYGCTQLLVRPDKLDKDGKLLESAWFDEQACDLVTANAPHVETRPSLQAAPGGPQDDAPNRR